MEISFKKNSGLLETPNGRVWYQLQSTSCATPLVIIHGGPGFPSDYLSPLSAVVRLNPVLFYDQLGCGRSDRPDNPEIWKISRAVDELELLRKKLKFKRMHLFGHSWGAIVALEYATLFPSKVSSIIFASPSISMELWKKDALLNISKLPAKQRHAIEKASRTGEYFQEDYQKSVAEYYSRHVCRLNPKPEELLLAEARAGAEVYNTMWGPNEFTPLGTLASYDGRQELPKLNIPVSYSAGAYDEVSKESLEEYRKLTPIVESLRIFSNSSHNPQLEETEEYCSFVATHLEEQHKREKKERKQRILISSLLLAAIVLVLFFSGCKSERVPGGEIIIRNDILDEDYNSFVVDQLSTWRGPTAFRKTLKPREEIALPYKNIKSMRFTRRYQKHDKIYVISCPRDLESRITIKLIDVHSNRLAGGCELNKRGERKHGRFTKWE